MVGFVPFMPVRTFAPFPSLSRVGDLSLLRTMSRFLAGSLATWLLLASPLGWSAEAVSVNEDRASFEMSNGELEVRVDKKTGNLIKVRYRDTDLLGKEKGYWSFVGRDVGLGARPTTRIRIDPTSNGGERVEVSCEFKYDPQAGGLPVDVDIRYALERGQSAIYCYSIWHHSAAYPAFGVAEARYALKLDGSIFDTLTVDEKRRGLMPSGEDWDRAKPRELKEVREIVTGRFSGRVEHKYDYSAILSDTPAYGWSSQARKLGVWLINPSIEYIGGGPTKVELTGHLDVNPGGSPTLLNMWVGSHYGGSSLRVAKGEEWSKCIGPFLIYCNASASHDDLWKGALARAELEKKAWPYRWLKDAEFPSVTERGAVKGQFVIDEPNFAAHSQNAIHIGLTHPDYESPARRVTENVDWQRDAKFYQFWTKVDANGHFNIGNVRAGHYVLRAFADGVLGEFAKTGVVITAGGVADLGVLTWTPVRMGSALWEIGVPNRSAAEFRHGDNYWQWGLFYRYATEFPNDVHYVVGKSDWARDWNYCQPARRLPDQRLASATTWTVQFELPELPRGRATLRLAFAGNRSPSGIDVLVNDAVAGRTGPLPDTGVMHRDGIRGYWFERQVSFDAALLKAGTNTLKLRLPVQNWVDGVLYDYLRLELEQT